MLCSVYRISYHIVLPRAICRFHSREQKVFSRQIAASSLGYGVKIVSSPTMTLNGDSHDALCEKLGVDPSMQTVAVLLIGKKDESVDATSGATTREPMENKVSFVE